MTGVLHSDVAFERAVLVKSQRRDTFLFGLIVRRHRRLEPLSGRIGEYAVNTFFLPAHHRRRDILPTQIEKLPRLTRSHDDTGGTQGAGDVHVPLKKTTTSIW